MSDPKRPTFFMTATSNSCQYIVNDTQKQHVPLIYGEDLSCEFDQPHPIHAVDHISFGIQEGQITAIIGESGSGKSSLLKLIYGLLEPSSGEIRYRGWLVPTRRDKLIPGHDAMKLVSQGFDDLNTYAKVWDNIASQLSNTDLKLKTERTKKVLQQLRIDHLAEKRVADLSGGEKQRVAISRALINDPEVLLMDEPFNQVDAAFRDQLQQDIREIVETSGLTVLLVSHDPAEVLAMADQLIVMKAGKIADQGTSKALYYRPKTAYTARLLAKSNILTAQEAKKLGVDSLVPIVVHQEHIQMSPNSKGRYRIQDIRFRGFYNEIIAGDEQIRIHFLEYPPGQLEQGDPVDLRIKNFHPLDDEVRPG